MALAFQVLSDCYRVQKTLGVKSLLEKLEALDLCTEPSRG